MNGNKADFTGKQAETRSFSRVVMIEMKKKYYRHLIGLITALIGIYLVVLLIGFTMLPFYKHLFLNFGESRIQLQLHHELSIAQNLMDNIGERFTVGLSALAQTDGVIDSTKRSKPLLNRENLSNVFSSFSGKQDLDFLFLIDSDGRVIYAFNDFNETVTQFQDHPLVIIGQEGKTDYQYLLETKEWLSSIGLSAHLIRKSEKEKKNELSPVQFTDSGLCLEACVPVVINGLIKGVLFGGTILNGNSVFLDRILGMLDRQNKNDSFLSLIVDNIRIASTFITKKGYIENTIASIYFDDQQINNKYEFKNNEKILDDLYLTGYIPIRNKNLQTVCILEMGHKERLIFSSFVKFFYLIRTRIIILIIVTSIIAGLIIRTVSLRFSNRLFVSLNTMADKISLLINKMADVSTHIKQTSTEILASSKEQAAYFDQQAASISETTATMEELATVTKQIANNAEQVVKVTEQTSINAENGFQSVLDTVKSMQEIKEKNEMSAQEIIALGEKSQKIGQVMRIITNIASQTKLIAFNASIEASAAGEIGKRFGVVATEVRRLAEDVVQSTEIIKRIITEIQKSTNRLVFVSEEETKKIDDGVHLSEVSGDSLKEILQMVTKSIQSAKQISLITQQQKTATDQVVSHLKEIALGAGESVKSSKHINNVILQLDELSKDLNALVTETTQFVEKRETT